MRWVILDKKKVGKVISIFYDSDETSAPENAIQRDDLDLGDELLEDGSIIKFQYVEPISPVVPLVMTDEKMLTQIHSMLCYLSYTSDMKNTL